MDFTHAAQAHVESMLQYEFKTYSSVLHTILRNECPDDIDEERRIRSSILLGQYVFAVVVNTHQFFKEQTSIKFNDPVYDTLGESNFSSCAWRMRLHAVTTAFSTPGLANMFTAIIGLMFLDSGEDYEVVKRALILNGAIMVPTLTTTP